MSRQQIKGVLEIDNSRGVVYFHSTETGATVLRICSLPMPIPQMVGTASMDITHMTGCSYVEDSKSYKD